MAIEPVQNDSVLSTGLDAAETTEQSAGEIAASIDNEAGQTVAAEAQQSTPEQEKAALCGKHRNWHRPRVNTRRRNLSGFRSSSRTVRKGRVRSPLARRLQAPKIRSVDARRQAVRSQGA